MTQNGGQRNRRDIKLANTEKGEYKDRSTTTCFIERQRDGCALVKGVREKIQEADEWKGNGQ